jgi:hypothetical protein
LRELVEGLGDYFLREAFPLVGVDGVNWHGVGWVSEIISLCGWVGQGGKLGLWGLRWVVEWRA